MTLLGSCKNLHKFKVKGSSIKYVHSDLIILDPPALLHVQLCFQPTLTLPSPSTSIRISFFKEDMIDIFCELLSIQEPQTKLQNKETIVQSYRKMPNEKTKKSPGIQCALFNCKAQTGFQLYEFHFLYFISVL